MLNIIAGLATPILPRFCDPIIEGGGEGGYRFCLQRDQLGFGVGGEEGRDGGGGVIRHIWDRTRPFSILHTHWRKNNAGRFFVPKKHQHNLSDKEGGGGGGGFTGKARTYQIKDTHKTGIQFQPPLPLSQSRDNFKFYLDNKMCKQNNFLTETRESLGFSFHVLRTDGIERLLISVG